MTVRRSRQTIFVQDRLSVAESVRKVLNKCPPYRNSAESDKDVRFTTNIKPSWWLLGTDMVVTVEEAESGTVVTANIVSQPYIIGDVFHCYDRYIDEFFASLNPDCETSR